MNNRTVSHYKAIKHNINNENITLYVSCINKYTLEYNLNCIVINDVSLQTLTPIRVVLKHSQVYILMHHLCDSHKPVMIEAKIQRTFGHVYANSSVKIIKRKVYSRWGMH